MTLQIPTLSPTPPRINLDVTLPGDLPAVEGIFHNSFPWDLQWWRPRAGQPSRLQSVVAALHEHATSLRIRHPHTTARILQAAALSPQVSPHSCAHSDISSERACADLIYQFDCGHGVIACTATPLLPGQVRFAQATLRLPPAVVVTEVNTFTNTVQLTAVDDPFGQQHRVELSTFLHSWQATRFTMIIIAANTFDSVHCEGEQPLWGHHRRWPVAGYRPVCFPGEVGA
ncbi:hypothetical protein ACFPVT_00060 [Corynebacterium choanae]|uniref:Uncharacterized protein n=1 Tax=Corynebacterium choanae TaxID=1862358 RepID=A0A3G6J4U4_9CORY|nr:hypothetical protein [Corynebacterium choanae]AZA13105.1 hypothetical protein CCHOA_03470 [Corynebacterium choanae]